MAQMVMSTSMCTGMTSHVVLSSWHMVVVFDEAVYLNNAMLIPFYFFIEVVGLDLS